MSFEEEFPISKEVMEAVQGISRKRAEKIEKMFESNIPNWKRWIMKKNNTIGKLFGYGIAVKPEIPKEGEMHREEITLMCRKQKLYEIIFIVKHGD